MANKPIVFLKLGGSLITDKRGEEAARVDVLERVAVEISAAVKADSSLKGRLVIGHGAGSFGHVHAHKYGIRGGCKTPRQWQGYALTANAVGALGRIVVAALLKADLPAWLIQPGACTRCSDGRVVEGPIQAVAGALDQGLIPVVHGDMALDDTRGGVVVSTEECFESLLRALPGVGKTPGRVVLAGEVDGIFTADPQVDPQAKLIPAISQETYHEVKSGLGGAFGTDVTGGMSAKVEHALGMAKEHNIDVVVCSGLVENNVTKALTEPSTSKCPGTSITSTTVTEEQAESGCIVS
mmetsp:Transcript_14293/g.21024  ORF Transcript_14293/g.21024 Transcript_14293/m.21024 type:complete len:296 (-) Transcript_14293:223-1110(-)|eukprot:CAMPEP_0113944672 /NCGR_PEP_ID=MMETSP1339-20121228/35417_1 /TAXON_ID=94617 /ORGANISM="Fibrocapsa japonica" /LENGTH=295 /DNA_ID=CAMNT_0000949953 /DNA_START=57 /DNA_END=944 /DNA_ORIENTATION=+ /assembly_acc=CAM_ASM_000762